MVLVYTAEEVRELQGPAQAFTIHHSAAIHHSSIIHHLSFIIPHSSFILHPSFIQVREIIAAALHAKTLHKQAREELGHISSTVYSTPLP
jgi:hypothetical protein